MKDLRLKLLSLFGTLSVALLIAACSSDDSSDPEEELDPEGNPVAAVPVASFQYEASDTDPLTFEFTNFSQNASSYSWDFGDESDEMTEENATHTFADYGTYTVVLTAMDEDGVSDDFTEEITIIDPIILANFLAGTGSKTWQLIANTETNLYPYEIAPQDLSDIWWQIAGNNDPETDLCYRSCVMDDTWTFNIDGTFVYDNNGDFYASDGLWSSDVADGGTGCFDATNAANWVGPGDEDLSGWNSGTHSYVYDSEEGTLDITGGFVGLMKVGTEGEVSVPQSSISYDVTKVAAGDVTDTLVLQVFYMQGEVPAYWKFGLVSYHDENDAIVVGECAPVTEVDVTFALNMNDYEGDFTTPAVSGTFNGWSGDASQMTDANEDGIWEVTVTLNADTDYDYKFQLDNWNAEESLDETEDAACTITDSGFTNRRVSTGTSDLTMSTVCWNSCDNCASGFTAEDLVGDWVMAPIAGSYGYGPAAGDISWWANSATDVTERSCFYDDVWTFDAEGNFSYAQGGSTFLEPWQGTEYACGTPVSPHDGSGSYTYTANATTITLNGTGAFLGLSKVINDAELTAPGDAPSSVTYTIVGYTGGATPRLTIARRVDTENGGTWTFVFDKQVD